MFTLSRPLAWAGVVLISTGLSIATAQAKSDKTAVPKSEYGSYVVIMTADPVISYSGGEPGYQATKPGKNKKINPKSAHVRKYQQKLQSDHNQAMSAAGLSAGSQLHDYTIALNGFAAIMSHEQASKLALRKDVARVMPDELHQKHTDNSTTFLDLTAPAGPYSRGYDGAGIVIGVIDSGIWPEHPSFADDGTYPESPVTDVPCEFGNQEHRSDIDVPFSCNNKLIGARQVLPTYRAVIGVDPSEFDSARDDDGHGTHTAATAAGNSGVAASISGNSFGLVGGVASRAHIIAYKGLGALGGFGSDLAAAIDQAVADGVDVINYSIGSSSFAIGPDDVAFLFAANAGVFVATSNGNSGPGPATTGSPASVPWVTSVGASTQDRTFLGSVSSPDGWEFFGESVTTGTVELPLVDAADAGDALCNPGDLDPNAVTGKIVLCLRGAIARVAKSEAVLQAGGAGMILYNANDAQSQVTDNHWVPSVHINNTDGEVIKAYIASTADPVATITGGEYTEVDAPFMADFSSRGPNRLSPDLIKPDVTAPGVNILAGNTPYPQPGSVPGELFQSISGTSMSSPHVAGLFALIKQAYPDWTSAMAKSALMTTAYQSVNKEDNATAADPFDMGSGHVNPGGKANKGSVFEPGLAFDAGLLEYAAYTCGENLAIFSPGSCAFLEGNGFPTDPSDLNLPSIGINALAGSQTVARTVTSVAKEKGWRTYYPQVSAPLGYRVEVSPASLRLKSGMSASFDVTVANVSAPAGEWRFGSLTWADQTGHFTVYSPIAVNGALIGVPDLVTGSGEAGSASFEVGFGYDGPYTAAAHGLEPATVTSETVVQDPDQAFNPGDGFSNVYTVTVSDAAILKFAMPPEAVASGDVDLDLFLYNPVGVQVASSTNGGTDEVIEIIDPADGEWTLYVHGWQTAGPSADYDLYGWVVSATPGGNLSVDNAPETAVVGNVGTVDVSWTGATTGQWHLGAVSHSDGGGLIGLTRVEVDNR
mgnify:CR=1 FL=1